MFKIILVVTVLTALQLQVVLSQCPRQPYVVNRPLVESVLESPRNYISQLPPTVISETPCNCQIPLTPSGPSSTTIITDCSPTACKNLANTLQLMIVCNLLQNTKGGSDLALQLAAPMINELFTSPVLSCGCSNPFATNVVSPTFVNPTVVSPNIISGSNAVSTVSNNQLLAYANGLLSGIF